MDRGREPLQHGRDRAPLDSYWPSPHPRRVLIIDGRTRRRSGAVSAAIARIWRPHISSPCTLAARRSSLWVRCSLGRRVLCAYLVIARAPYLCDGTFATHGRYRPSRAGSSAASTRRGAKAAVALRLRRKPLAESCRLAASGSQIQPVIVGADERATRLAAAIQGSARHPSRASATVRGPRVCVCR